MIDPTAFGGTFGAAHALFAVRRVHLSDGGLGEAFEKLRHQEPLRQTPSRVAARRSDAPPSSFLISHRTPPARTASAWEVSQSTVPRGRAPPSARFGSVLIQTRICPGARLPQNKYGTAWRWTFETVVAVASGSSRSL